MIIALIVIASVLLIIATLLLIAVGGVSVSNKENIKVWALTFYKEQSAVNAERIFLAKMLEQTSDALNELTKAKEMDAQRAKELVSQVNSALEHHRQLVANAIKDIKKPKSSEGNGDYLN